MKLYGALLLSTLVPASAQTFVNKGAPDVQAGAHKPVVNDATDPAYVIGADDVLAVTVWKEPELSATVPVRSDGKISLPLLNDVQAAGLTPAQLAADVSEKVRKFITDPSVTVIVTQMNSRKAYIMGLVNHQGMVRLQANMTVLQALSAAGGLAPFANRKKIYVLRTENGQEEKLPFNYDAVIKGKDSAQNVLLKPGDTVVVP
ncbi:MAG TPA: polysaccharide biosynthesis/export family protein [Pseudacidobacterium sp.]|nr:polysaccharide biosynthesis/export family protein [Pseudacidobacterium sp.]